MIAHIASTFYVRLDYAFPPDLFFLRFGCILASFTLPSMRGGRVRCVSCLISRLSPFVGLGLIWIYATNYIPLRPSEPTRASQRVLRFSDGFSAGPNQSVRTEKPANHNIPHRSWAFTFPGKNRTISGCVPLVMMMRAVLPRNRRCQNIVRAPVFVLM